MQIGKASTAVTIPIAAERLELISEGSRLCREQEIVRETGLSGHGHSVLGARLHREGGGGLGAQEGSGPHPDLCRRADTASPEQGTLKMGGQQLVMKEFEALGPQLGWQLPGGLHQGSIEHFGEAQNGSDCRGNGMSCLANPVCLRPGALQGYGGLSLTAAHGGGVDGDRALAGALCQGGSQADGVDWKAPGWRRYAQRCLCPQPLGAPGQLALGAGQLGNSASCFLTTDIPSPMQWAWSPSWCLAGEREVAAGDGVRVTKAKREKGPRSTKKHQSTTAPAAWKEPDRPGVVRSVKDLARDTPVTGMGGLEPGTRVRPPISTSHQLKVQQTANDVPVGGGRSPGHSNGRGEESHCLQAPGCRGWPWVPCHSQVGTCPV